MLLFAGISAMKPGDRIGRLVLTAFIPIQMDLTMSNSADRHTILVVDDDVMSLEMLAGILAKEYDLVAARSGAEVLALLSGMQPDLILLDVVMPEMDGYEVCQRIKAIPGLSDIPVLFLTCMAELECESRGLEVGAVDYITKPYNPHITRLRIRNHLKIKTRCNMLAQQYQMLQRQDSFFKEFFRNHSAPMMLIDLESNIIVDANRSATSFYGYSHDEITGMSITAISGLAADE